MVGALRASCTEGIREESECLCSLQATKDFINSVLDTNGVGRTLVPFGSFTETAISDLALEISQEACLSLRQKHRLSGHSVARFIVLEAARTRGKSHERGCI